MKCEFCKKKVTHRVAVLVRGNKTPICTLKVCQKCKTILVKIATEILKKYFAAIKETEND